MSTRSRANQVTKASLRLATCTPYPRQADGPGKKAKWNTAHKHKCCHDYLGRVVEINIADGAVVTPMKCIASQVVPEFSVFASEQWTFECVDGSETTVKLCKCCASYFLEGNENLDAHHRSIRGQLRTTWGSHTLANGVVIDDVVGSVAMMNGAVKKNNFCIAYEAFKDNQGVPARAVNIMAEVNELRQGGVLLRNNFGNKGTSSGFAAWDEIRQLIGDKPILRRWLEAQDAKLRSIGDFIRNGYFTSYDQAQSYLDWHADLNYFLCWYRSILTLGGDGNKCMFIINRHTGEWFGFKVVHGMEVIMSRRFGGPDDRGMMHVVPVGDNAKFIALEFGKLKKIKDENDTELGEVEFEQAGADDEVMDEEQFLQMSGHVDAESLLAEAQGVTHDLED